VRCRAELRSADAAPLPTGVDSCTAVLAYEGAGRELLARLKYRNARSCVAWLAGQMAAAIEPTGIDVVTWVPTTVSRRRGRGFDQGELLARAVARRLHRPCRELLSRRDGPPQTGRDAASRREGPTLVLRHARVPARVLLIDDVITTGSSVTAAARTLRGGGAHLVRVCAGARTSLKRTGKASETCL
jgi:predicted amidophosphoribosyltransferase